MLTEERQLLLTGNNASPSKFKGQGLRTSAASKTESSKEWVFYAAGHCKQTRKFFPAALKSHTHETAFKGNVRRKQRIRTRCIKWADKFQEPFYRLRCVRRGLTQTLDRCKAYARIGFGENPGH